MQILKREQSSVFIILIKLYLGILLTISCIACLISYHQRKELLLTEIDAVYEKLEKDYTETIDNFWQIYMPIFESESVYSVLSQYFENPNGKDLSPLEKNEFYTVLRQMANRDSQILWIALYSENRETNYIYFQNNQSLVALDPDFPYMDYLSSAEGGMAVFETEPVTNNEEIFHTFAICGETPSTMQAGKILVGYDLSPLDQICRTAQSGLSSLTFLLTTENMLTHRTEFIYQSSGNYDENTQYIPEVSDENEILAADTASLYMYSKAVGLSYTTLTYHVSRWELFLRAHQNTPLILVIVVAFAFLSMFFYSLMMKHITQEVNVIRGGLELIGENNLEYRLPTNFQQNGFSEIAQSINQMSNTLSEHINQSYHYKLRQQEAELAELQAKFNPHFLYNSLEMLRSRCIQSGDSKTADLISQLSAIFRGFIGSRLFIPLHEELAFSRRYLTLFGARYRDQVEFIYDIDTELLQYGIIRNLFQPLIENYFVHGIKSSNNEGNYIMLRGKSLDDETMLLSVDDNGYGMDPEELEQLNARLREPIQMEHESYGLKNLHQRIRLFYGEGCGLNIVPNGDQGLSIQMTVRKMTCAEYEAMKH